jgi:hypothetical protein
MRKQRGYKRETPEALLRDYKLFAIACEGGKREPEYFNLLRFISRRVSVDIIQDVVSDEEMETTHQNKSAPRWVLDRAMRYIEKEGLSDEDELWFVLDKDRWSDEQLREIFEYCQQKTNWNIVISHPCFEVWLYFHKKKEIDNSGLSSCNDFKRDLSTFFSGGYHPLKFIGHIVQAAANARESDTDKEHFLPAPYRTKLYLLAESVMSFVGNNDFERFLTVIIPDLIKSEMRKTEAAKKK